MPTEPGNASDACAPYQMELKTIHRLSILTYYRQQLLGATGAINNIIACAVFSGVESTGIRKKGEIIETVSAYFKNTETYHLPTPATSRYSYY